MNLKAAGSWITEHPAESIVIGLGGALAILWMLGAFSKPAASQANAGASNLASAYYAAEAQQAVVGGQIQGATIAAAAATRQNADNANAAVAINAANSNAAAIINGQNATRDTTVNASSNDAAVAINRASFDSATTLGLAGYAAANHAADAATVQAGYAAETARQASAYGYYTAQTAYASADTAAGYAAQVANVANNNQLLATYSNNDTALKTQQATIAGNLAYTDATNHASILQLILGKLLPAEMANPANPGYGVINVPGYGGFSALATIPDLNALTAGGLTHGEALEAGGLT